MLKIAVIGAHGVGKTTLCTKLLAYALKHNKLAYTVTEVVRSCPYPINDKSSLEGAVWIVTTQISNELAAQSENPEYLICDRSAIDPVLYLQARSMPVAYNDLCDFAHSWMKTYDTLIYIKPDDEKIDEDGFRDVDPVFRRQVDDEFSLYVTNFTARTTAPILHVLYTEDVFDKSINKFIKKIFEE